MVGDLEIDKRLIFIAAVSGNRGCPMCVAVAPLESFRQPPPHISADRYVVSRKVSCWYWSPLSVCTYLSVFGVESTLANYTRFRGDDRGCWVCFSRLKPIIRPARTCAYYFEGEKWALLCKCVVLFPQSSNRPAVPAHWITLLTVTQHRTLLYFISACLQLNHQVLVFIPVSFIVKINK